MANCDIPDLDVLSPHYGIASIQFSAELELGVMHLGLWALSWLVRLGIPLHLPNYAPTLLAVSNWFDRFGSSDGGMHVLIRGRNTEGASHERGWFIIARDGYGPHIPTIPAIVLAKKIARGESLKAGAYPCVAMVTLEEYREELQGMLIATSHEASLGIHGDEPACQDRYAAP